MLKSKSFPNCSCLSLQFAGTVKEQLLRCAVWELAGAVLGLAGAGPGAGSPCPLDGASWGRAPCGVPGPDSASFRPREPRASNGERLGEGGARAQAPEREAQSGARAPR